MLPKEVERTIGALARIRNAPAPKQPSRVFPSSVGRAGNYRRVAVNVYHFSKTLRN